MNMTAFDKKNSGYRLSINQAEITLSALTVYRRGYEKALELSLQDAIATNSFLQNELETSMSAFFSEEDAKAYFQERINEIDDTIKKFKQISGL